jgi:hypothetical protein
MLVVGNSRGELFTVEGGVARGPRGVEVEVPWSGVGIHYGPVIVSGGRVYKPGGELVGDFNLVLVPYGLYGDGYVQPRYGLFVEGERLLVVDLERWAVAKSLRCRGKWDYMPTYPFADEKSIYCTDGFVAYATPFGYGVSSAPCGLSYYVDVLNPGRAFVVDYEHGEDSLEMVAKVISLRGEYLDVVEMEFRKATAVEPLSAKPLYIYVEDGAGSYLVTESGRLPVERPFFISSRGVVVGDLLNGAVKLSCAPAYVHGRYYLCGGEVRELP